MVLLYQKTIQAATVSFSQTLHVGGITIMMEKPSLTSVITETDTANMNSSPVALIAEPSELKDENPKSDKFKPDRHFWLAFSPLTVLMVMVALDSTILSVALPVSHRPVYLYTYTGHLYLREIRSFPTAYMAPLSRRSGPEPAFSLAPPTFSYRPLPYLTSLDAGSYSQQLLYSFLLGSS